MHVFAPLRYSENLKNSVGNAYKSRKNDTTASTES